MASKWIFTTSYKPNKEQVLKAKSLANEYSGIYIRRKYLNKKIDTKNTPYFVVEKNLTVKFRFENNELFFHPSAAKIRYINYYKFGKDYLIEALNPKGNEIVLDLTFGLGSEALLMAHFLKEGKVVGIEGSFPIFVVVKNSINFYPYNQEWMKEAIKRIEIIHEDYRKFLSKLEDDSYDVIYCDPMFENPKYESSSMNPLRHFAIYDTIKKKDIDEFLRVAKKKVIIKARDIDSIWNRIEFDKVIGSERSGVYYGVIYK